MFLLLICGICAAYVLWSKRLYFAGKPKPDSTSLSDGLAGKKIVHPDLQIKEVTLSSDKHRVFASTSHPEYETKMAARLKKSTTPKKRMWEDDLVFVTSRPDKVKEFKEIVPSVNFVPVDLRFGTLEGREESLAEIAAYRVFQAFKVLRRRCCVEECSFELKSKQFQNPYPGHLYRQVVEQQIGKRNFAEMHDGTPAKTTNMIAYTEDGVVAHIFSGSVNGVIKCAPLDKWRELEHVDGWDCMFYPDGYDCSLAEMRSVKSMVNMRTLPCLEMLATMRGEEFPGVFELHVTVYNADVRPSQGVDNDGDADAKNPLRPTREYVEKFRASCAKVGQKALVVEMDAEDKANQLQTAGYFVFASAAEAQACAFGIGSSLMKLGHPVLRIRVEALAHNRNVPDTDAQAAFDIDNKNNYFEFHARVGASSTTTMSNAQMIHAKLEEAVVQKHAPSLLNIGSHKKGQLTLKVSKVNGRVFLNGRAFLLGHATAKDRWEWVLSQLDACGLTVEKRVKDEYCLFDSKIKLDDERFAA